MKYAIAAIAFASRSHSPPSEPSEPLEVEAVLEVPGQSPGRRGEVIGTQVMSTGGSSCIVTVVISIGKTWKNHRKMVVNGGLMAF